MKTNYTNNINDFIAIIGLLLPLDMFAWGSTHRSVFFFQIDMPWYFKIIRHTKVVLDKGVYKPTPLCSHHNRFDVYIQELLIFVHHISKIFMVCSSQTATEHAM